MGKVKMTNAEVIGLSGCLNSICNDGLNFKPRTWMTLASNRKALLEQGKLIDEANKKITEKFKVNDPEEGEIIPKKHVAEYNRLSQEVLGDSAEIEINTLNLSDVEKEMPKMKGVSNLFLLFDYVIVEDKPKKKK